MSTLVKRRHKVPRTRASGTLTEAAFWGYIRSLLRKKSMAWKPIREAFERARRPNQSSNARLKWEYQCADCKDWFPAKEVEIDHINEAGSLTCADDLPGFVERLFCEVDGLQVLCTTCHNKKTHGV